MHSAERTEGRRTSLFKDGHEDEAGGALAPAGRFSPAGKGPFIQVAEGTRRPLSTPGSWAFRCQED